MTKIAIILTEGFADWEYALIGGTGGPYYGMDVTYFAPVAGPLQSMGGLEIRAQKGLNDLAAWQADLIVVVGGTIWEGESAPDISELLRDQVARGAAVAGICAGTLALARAGLLDDIAHTSNSLDFLEQNAGSYAGAANYIASGSAVSENKIITAPGFAPVSFAAEVFMAAGLPQEQASEFKEMMARENAH